ncbi:VOC family protein [Chelatococcus sp. GCM10030263]|uniref:VOC family protein n=1 Tax=Chelatococcus sp. GCM10030263 TaxID=3273387 RepID=UPI0036146615
MAQPFAASVSLITLGVSDVARSTAFYERLGWRRSAGASTDEVSFFALESLVLALWSRAELAADAGLADTPPGFGGFALAQNKPSEEAVDAALAAAVAGGGRLLKPAARTSWGGYSGYFADLDSHPWEIAHNPFFPLDATGRVTLPA